MIGARRPRDHRVAALREGFRPPAVRIGEHAAQDLPGRRPGEDAQQQARQRFLALLVGHGVATQAMLTGTTPAAAMPHTARTITSWSGPSMPRPGRPLLAHLDRRRARRVHGAWNSSGRQLPRQALDQHEPERGQETGETHEPEGRP